MDTFLAGVVCGAGFVVLYSIATIASMYLWGNFNQ